MLQQIPVIFGEVLFDCFEDGSRVLGGAPFNVAWHLQAFGAAPLFISRVGDDPQGRQIRGIMRNWGMSTACLQMDSAHPTGEVRVSLNDGQPNFEILADRAYDHILSDHLPPMQPELVYHGSLGLRHADSTAALDELLQRHSVPVFMDVNLRPPWWEREQIERLFTHTCWLKINDAELMQLVEGAGGLEEKARTLKERYGMKLIIVTQGAKGAFALDDQGEITEVAPAAKVAVVDTVGAGDAFASICILGLLQGWPLSQIMQRAQAFASLLVGRRGATIDDARVYRPLINEWGLA